MLCGPACSAGRPSPSVPRAAVRTKPTAAPTRAPPPASVSATRPPLSAGAFSGFSDAIPQRPARTPPPPFRSRFCPDGPSHGTARASSARPPSERGWSALRPLPRSSASPRRCVQPDYFVFSLSQNDLHCNFSYGRALPPANGPSGRGPTRIYKFYLLRPLSLRKM